MQVLKDTLLQHDWEDAEQQPGESFSRWEQRQNFPSGVPVPSWPLSYFQVDPLQHLSLAPLEPDSLMPTLTVGVLPDDDEETQSEAPPDDVRVRPPKRPRSPTPCREGCVCLGGSPLKFHHCCNGLSTCCKGGNHRGQHYCRLCLVSASSALLPTVLGQCSSRALPSGAGTLGSSAPKRSRPICVDGNCCFGPRSCFEPPGQ